MPFQWPYDLARGAIERFACFEEGDSADVIYDKAFNAANDELRALGLPPEEASSVASSVARDFAQP